ncbi:MAG: hypothetical protein CMF39_00765 [Legionellaceae bacterium]|nr:hypothetical protein [Legionellaceae bacterium]|tara:strand:+ start:529 stop:897 length:369 start_codon:yes stop_codon:yes gene_type:complete
MERTDLLKILHGDIDLIDHVDVHDVALYKEHVVIYPHHIKSILSSYLSDCFSSDVLTKWAQFICLRSEYGCPEWEDDDAADYYEDMMYVIQKLSTPEIDGEITKERAKEYLHELEKYDDTTT